ncbi:MAG: hypothetical protein JWM12_2588 [Ilumatobacteraceae bacterium]|nr:hypothetical protein [Ilumatobacteraceae bacterium]
MEVESNRTTYEDETRRVATPAVGTFHESPPYADPTYASPVTPVVTQVTPVATVAPVSEVRTVSRYGSMMPAALIAGIVAIGALILGGITVARAGTDTPFEQHVVNVAGFNATALLGYIELAFGALLLISALSRARQAILFFGIVGFVASVVGIFQPTVGNGSLGLERGFAVLAAILTAVVVVAAFLPTIRHSSSHLERI